MDEILTTEFLGIGVTFWLTAATFSIGGIVVALLIRMIAELVLRRRPGEGHFIRRTVASFVVPAVIVAGFSIGVRSLPLTETQEAFMAGVFVVLFSIIGIRFVVLIVSELFRRAAEEDARVSLSQIRPLQAIVVFTVWVIGIVFLLANLGFDVGSIIAGLGIGGIAIAIAATALLGDLFSYFVIVFDKPFEIGDFLIFGDVLGSVERIGVKTTRLRSLGGEQIIVPNSDLTGSRVRNYKRMERRRVVFQIGVQYGTNPEHIREIPQIIQSVIERDELAVFDRAHFASYGDWSLDFEVVYNVASPDYNLYMDVQQRINLAIYDEFNSRGIEFAFPTQTIQLEGVGRTNGT